MSDRGMVFISTISIILVIFIIHVIMPKLTRKDIYFGVRVPAEEINRKELVEIYKKYLKYTFSITAIYLVIFCIIVFSTNSFIVVFQPIGVILYLIIAFLIYYKANRKVKEVKEEFGWYKTKRAATVIDTNFTKDKRTNVLVSPWWFMIPVLIIIANVIIGLNSYDRLPDIIPMHWNIAGQVDRWVEKSHKTIFEMPFTQFFMTLILFFSYKIIGWSKQQISASNPEASKEQNIIFRRRWSGYMVIMTILLNLLFTYVNLNVLQIIKISGKGMLFSTMIFTLLILVMSVYVSVTTGQGGSRIKLKSGIGAESGLLDRDDDKYWKFGNSIYVNQEDPALFVEKRFGIGWTINFGRVEGLMIFVGLLVFIALMKFVFK